MENICLPPPDITLDPVSLIFTSLVLHDVHGLITCVQTIVAVLMRYVNAGLSITNSLVGLVKPVAARLN